MIKTIMKGGTVFIPGTQWVIKDKMEEHIFHV